MVPVGVDNGAEVYFRADSMAEADGATPLTLFRMATINTSDYFDFESICYVDDRFFSRLTNSAASQHADGILLSNIVSGTAFHRLAAGFFFNNHNCIEIEAVPSYGIRVQGGFEDYVKTIGKESGRNITRIRKKLQQAGAVFLLAALSTEYIDWLLDHQAIRAATKNYDAVRSTEVATILRQMIPDEHIQFAGVQLDGRLISGMVVFRYEDSLAIYIQAFDTAYAATYPSIYLLSELIACSGKHNITYIDLLRGDETYKERFCNHKTELVKLLIIMNEHKQAALEKLAKNLIE